MSLVAQALNPRREADAVHGKRKICLGLESVKVRLGETLSQRQKVERGAGDKVEG